jgi:hypothetical protein
MKEEAQVVGEIFIQEWGFLGCISNMKIKETLVVIVFCWES